MTAFGLGLGLAGERRQSALDPDAALFLAAAGITDATQRKAVDQLVIDLKAGGLWTKFDALYPFVGGAAVPHSYNLRDPSAYPIAWSGSIVHDANGITGDGATGYGDTGLALPPAIISDGHFSLYRRIFSSTESRDIGTGAATPQNVVGIINNSSSDTAEITGDYSVAGEAIMCGAPQLGHVICTARSVSDMALYYGGVAAATNGTLRTGTWAITTSAFILALNLAGTPFEVSSGNLGLASIGKGMTDAEAGDFAAAVERFQEALGRAV